MIGWVILSVIGLLLVGVILYIIIVYNGLIQLKNSIAKSWSNIDVLLKQRFDELPKLIKTCEGYMQHERQTLEAVIRARSAVGSARPGPEQIAAQGVLSEALRSLFLVVERYPELKADGIFRNLSSRISEIEEMIADRRELYNETVNLYNIRIEQFPDVLVARLFNFTGRTLWQIDPAHRRDVEVNFQQA